MQDTHDDPEHSFGKKHPRLHAAPAVFVGGVIGTAIRAALSEMQSSNWTWPWVTFCINMVGAALLGFLLEYLAGTGNDVGARQTFRLFAGTGVIGGFTTYGTFILETDTRLLGAHLLVGLSYAAVSIILGLVFAGCGVKLASLCVRQFSRKVGDNR